MSDRWKRQKKSADNTLWTFGEWSIELTSAGYELYQLATLVKVFADLQEAKQHAAGEMYLRGELRGRGRPKSAERCDSCGAPPSHQHRD